MSSSTRIRLRLRSPRRRWPAVLAVAALTALGLTGGSATAQTIPDAPELGFTIDPQTGAVGDTVIGQVDPADIAANCITDPAEFVRQFVDIEAGIEESPYMMVAFEYGSALDLETVDPAILLAAQIGAFFPLGLALDLEAEEPQGLAAEAMKGTFIMAFADLATAAPIAPYGNFDATTGEGSTVVPDLPGGTQPVIATCVGLPDEIDPAAYAAAVEAGAEQIRANFEEPYPDNAFGEEFAEVAGAVAPTMLEALIEPKGLGIAFYCVDDGEGSCDDPVDTTTTAPDTTTTPDGDGDSTPPPASGAAPISGRPSYTG